ncbi:calcium-binding protein [Rhodalgimonas zhirmunskyi]|uniref:Calcium-binding protein n=1 Tax=Rhodalgimonas zhirmunskyi TaxID=2964767 RepID=A0AAJ1U999_9RHOB|nr:calcium-binding protein [Rhodoalgimonas zhirmunskyi]MDQ2095324.1 hypothetical protein [Rhodoalgimonas zhirmunskyi]
MSSPLFTVVMGDTLPNRLDREGLGGERFFFIGLAGDDTLLGGMEDDLFAGGAGADEINGGDGSDWVTYESASTRFPGPGITIDLAAGAGTGGAAEGDVLISIENVIGSRSDDLIIGDDGNNILKGHTGNDTLRGGKGDDMLFGGVLLSVTDSDILDGGDGFDWANYRESTHQYGVSINTRNDHYANAARGDFFISIEGVIGTQATDGIIMGDEDNRIHGLGGDDFLDGGRGDDTLMGGEGRDQLYGNEGRDTAVYRFSDAGISIQKLTYGRGGDAEGDVLSAVEEIVGSQFDDTIEGAYPDVRFFGLDGDDWLSGGIGNGSDTLIGGAGADTLDGGEGRDRASYDGSDAGVTIDLEAGTANGGHATGDVLISIEELRGSLLNDGLFGDGGRNSLWGLRGDDMLDGRGGQDVIHGGNGNDTLRGGSGDDALFGGGGNDALRGNAGDDTLSGGAGDDTITGGDGDDMFVFNADDTQNGHDTVTSFVAGEDHFLVYSSDQAQVVVSDVTGGALIAFDTEMSVFVAGAMAAELTHASGPGGEWDHFTFL